eukprot:871176-Rhodomonas_salina.1
MPPRNVPRPREDRGEKLDLLCLPSPLWGRIWPADRVVAGLRVCWHLRQELAEHAGTVLMVKSAEAEIDEDALEADFSYLSKLQVVLIWQGRPAGLDDMVASLSTNLSRLDLSRTEIGDDGAAELAGVLGECK